MMFGKIIVVQSSNLANKKGKLARNKEISKPLFCLLGHQGDLRKVHKDRQLPSWARSGHQALPIKEKSSYECIIVGKI